MSTKSQDFDQQKVSVQKTYFPSNYQSVLLKKFVITVETMYSKEHSGVIVYLKRFILETLIICSSNTLKYHNLSAASNWLLIGLLLSWLAQVLFP